MGKKKASFIDKKNSTTYSLTYGGHDDDDAPDAVSMSQGSASRYDDGQSAYGPSAYGSESAYGYYDDFNGYVMTESRRKELIGLGFPDDGYDYLHHLKQLGPKTRRPSSRRKAASRASAAAAASGSGKDDVPGEGASAPGLAGVVEEEDGEEEDGEEGATEEEATGPSVFVAGNFLPPQEDTKLLDARQLVVQGKVQEDSEADKAAASVSAFARVHNTKLTRGRILHDLEDLEESMAHVEDKHEDGLGGQTRGPKAVAVGSTAVQFISKDGDDGSDEEEWDEWFDDFVVAAAKEEASIPEGPEGGEDEQGQDESEEEEEEVERKEAGQAAAAEGVRPAPSVAGSSGSKAGGVRAASIASSYWRPERQDRKGELGGLDDRFEQLATQYEDEALGELDDEDAAKARNNAKISDFANMLDDFLLEQAEMEALQDDQLQQAAAGGGRGKQGAAAKAAARTVAELGGDDGIEDYVGGDEYDEVHGLGGSDDDEAGAAGPSSGRRRAAVAAAAARDSAFLEGPAPVYRKGQALNQLDPEVIAKTRERIAVAEAEAAKRVERQEAAGGAPRHHHRGGAGSDGEDDDDDTGLAGEVGDLFNEQLPQVFVEREDRWDCESVLSLRSNLENHPARIAEPQRCAGARGGGAIKLSSKTGIPLAAVVEGAQAPSDPGSSGSDEGHLEDDFELLLLERRKDETPEEKRARKAAVKEAQREARASKKALRTMFREEGTKQRRQAAGRALGAPTGGSTFVIA